ncbi:MAG: hypothetical protein ABIP41_06645 [Croceibacterium sp.]
MNPTSLLRALLAAAAAIPAAVVALPPAPEWEIGPWVRGRNYSQGMPAQPSPAPGGTLAMEFPMAGRGQVDALTTAVGPLAGARQIMLRYRIDAAPGTRFVADERPGEPATVSLYFQQAGDSWSGTGRYESYRWYSPARTVIPLAPGVRSVTIRFDETWTNVNGHANSQDPAGYAAALANTARIGLAFGSASARSHGVYATGPARFTLLALDIG